MYYINGNKQENRQTDKEKQMTFSNDLCVIVV